MFAFHGLQSRVTHKPKMPDTITKWPMLPPDPLAASIEPPKRAGDLENRPGEELDEADDSNINSILAVSDTQGFLHCFLDGSCPLGSILVSALSTTSSLSKDPQQPILFAYRSAHGHTSLLPSSIHISLLAGRLPRDIARSSTTARELVWYVMRAVDEMRATWFGSDTQPGAKQPGQKWLQALQTLQPGGTGDKAMWSLTDLTLLLISGRSTEAISDFIGSGELMSERGLQKWETTVNEALMKLRDFAEQRVAPACQRFHIIMEEVLGWSQLPQFAICALQKEDIDFCLQMTSRAIVSANWLAATARRELSRFKEFMKWLRFEIANVNPTVEPMQQPRHDILEVNSYLMSGLVDSEIDSWFFHGPPKFSPQDLGVPHEKQDLPSVINRARHALLEDSSTNLSHTVIRRNLGTVARNMDTLIQVLAKRTEQIFALACEATARSARVSHNTGSMNGRPIPTAGPSSPDHTFIIRERTIVDKDEASVKASHFIQHLAIRGRSAEGRMCLCLIRLRYNREACSSPAYLGSAIIECRLAQDGGLFADFDLLDVDFFDDENLVVVFRTRDVPGKSPVR
ncbi:hypothetical protein EWM64_g8669 [Hericium alpestre]|uniref:Anaphase-promoting complex subunit 4 n=1 Tax=Hericium alpestre TaxID=135208 RepID=A0A4Y9ZM41_9AGAM|nr:hypothetical protein EWM64_g8669 [Hericium alpestre]